jgi:hypothetical protein
MRYVFVLALATGGIVVSACSGDDSSDDNNGGSSGASGEKTGGSSSGGSANKAGRSSGGEAGRDSGGEAGDATAGTSAMGGAPTAAGAGGTVDGGMGGANTAAAGGSDAGAGGMGAGGEPALVYACGSANQFQKTCSAWSAANCTNAVVCSDCVFDLTSAREDFQNEPPCDTCNAKYDAYYQCQIDAFESGDLAFGVGCFDGDPDGSDNCLPFANDAFSCEGYVAGNSSCPASWPPP